MLLRHLRRPLLRSVTTAWQPATTPPAPFHLGDGRRSSSENSSDGQQEADEQDGTQPTGPAPSRPRSSLFERLFPEDSRRSRAMLSRTTETDAPSRSAWMSQLFDAEPPRLPVPEELRDEADAALEGQPNSYSDSDSPALRAKSMLILSAASKNLLESDFIRLASKGKHVDGWVGGILKVIQARNPDTLEPKGHYFILFDTHEAALSYKGRLEHLYDLSKQHVPGVRGHGRMRAGPQSPLPPGLRRTEAGEDVASLIRAFTLVPPTQRYNVQLSRMSPARVAELHVAGGFVDQLAARAGSRFLVLVRVAGGRLTLDTLRRALDDDGARRRLAWRVAGLEKNGGILPFGKSVLKAQDQTPTDGSLATERPTQEEGKEDDDDKRRRSGAAGLAGGNGTVMTILQAREGDERYRQYPRFIIPFADEPEAYRFVQSWHRRELRLRMGGGGVNDPSWEESRMINATVLW
ncbi:hypothetical protein F5Y14DRAFT_395605 [Nemania sp. NC0429]|nr:hypothetical protein F5Y14DRAFT_395605 [Nemania sp. NC0429]